MSAFIRKIENFACEKCGNQVVGDGFTNHCPKCLWSKHVDIDPGDRSAACGGMMAPIDVVGTTPTYKILQKCEKCGVVRPITARDNDSVEALLQIVQKKNH